MMAARQTLNDPLARLAVRVGDALHEFAAAVQAPTAASPLDEEPAVRGARQQQILELEGLAEDDGMKVAEIAQSIAYDSANTHLTLRSLERRGLTELVPGKSPQHWRLSSAARKRGRLWEEDEIVLAMDLYVRANGKPDQRGLEETKQALDLWAIAHGSRPRPMAGLVFKLGNLHAIATNGLEGFSHGGSNDQKVWQRFCDRPDELRKAAQEIRTLLPSVDSRAR